MKLSDTQNECYKKLKVQYMYKPKLNEKPLITQKGAPKQIV